MGERITVGEALRRIREHVRPLPHEDVELSSRLIGRRTAETIFALRDFPPLDCSAMDGHAVRFADIESASRRSPALLRLGRGPCEPWKQGRCSAGEAVPVSTGSPVPAGGDTILPKERTRTVGDRLEVREAGMAGANIRRRGEDFFSGEPLLGAGAPLTAEIIGLLAAAGARRIRSARRPTLHLVPTGSEFLAPAPTRQAIRYDSNTPMIEALCAEMRLQCRSRDPVPDDADMLKEAISKEMASDADVLVSIGGSSVGAHDHILDVLTGLGARMVFHGIAMRPGKPLLFAMLPDGRPFFGLPGNPVAALIGFRIFVLAAAQAMEGRDSETAVAVVPTGLGREGITLFQAANFDAAAGRVDIIPGQRPHLLRPLTKADGWALVEMHEGVEQSSYFPRLPAL